MALILPLLDTQHLRIQGPINPKSNRLSGIARDLASQGKRPGGLFSEQLKASVHWLSGGFVYTQPLQQLTKRCGRFTLPGITQCSLKIVLRGHESAKDVVVSAILGHAKPTSMIDSLPTGRHCHIMPNDARDTRTRTLNAAQDLVQRRGLNAMTMQDLSNAVGIRKASVHHHFATKAEIVGACLLYTSPSPRDRG